MQTLWAHQQEAIERAGKRFALFFDPGCGKSRTAIELYKKACGEFGVPIKAIIFAPLNVCRNWISELNKYLGENHRAYLVAGQSKSQKIKILEDFIGDHAGHRFLICNTEALRSKDYLARLKCSAAQFIIADESHYFKSPESQQTKGLLSLVHALHAEWVYLLTGTPAPQGWQDLYTSFLLLKQTNDNFYIWRKKHFNDANLYRKGNDNYWPDYRIKPDSQKYFERILVNFSASAKKDVLPDLPPILRLTMHAELGAGQKRAYRDMLKTLLARDDQGNELTAANALSRTMRLQQIISGCSSTFYANDAFKVLSFAEIPRLNVLREAIEQTAGAQFIVWTTFTATYDAIAKVLESLAISFGRLTGEESAQERHQAMEDFQAGKIRALIANPRAGGVGVNLTAASFAIYYSRSFNLVDDIQSEARCHRAGSGVHERITRIDIVTPDTIDEDIVEALRQKKSMQDFITQLKDRYGERSE